MVGCGGAGAGRERLHQRVSHGCVLFDFLRFFFPFVFSSLFFYATRRREKKELTLLLSLSPPLSRKLRKKTPGRILRDAKLYEIGAGTSEIRRLVIGRELVREAAEAEGGGGR